MLHSHAPEANKRQLGSVAGVVTTAQAWASPTALQHVRQQVVQTEGRTAALERQLVQEAPGTGQATDGIAANKSLWVTNHSGQKETTHYMDCLSSLMRHMAARKPMLQQGHSQHLQVSWPLSIAPNPDQQAFCFAQVSRSLAPLQSTPPISGLSLVQKLKIQPNCGPLADAAVLTAEKMYWQNTSISSSTAADGKLVLQPEMQQLEITALQASPSNAHLAVGSVSGIVTILSLQRNSSYSYLRGDPYKGARPAGGPGESVTGMPRLCIVPSHHAPRHPAQHMLPCTDVMTTVCSGH